MAKGHDGGRDVARMHSLYLCVGAGFYPARRFTFAPLAIS